MGLWNTWKQYDGNKKIKTKSRRQKKDHLHIEYQKVYKNNRSARTDHKTCTEKLVNAVEQAVSEQDMQTQIPLPLKRRKG